MHARLESIFNKVNLLLDQNKQLKTENSKLIEELELARNVQNRLKKDLETLLQEKESMESNSKFNTLAAGNLSKEEIKAKIDQYISEIDNCIAQIEKL